MCWFQSRPFFVWSSPRGCVGSPPRSKNMLVGLISSFKFFCTCECEFACFSLYVARFIIWQFAQCAPCLSPCDSWDMLERPRDFFVQHIRWWKIGRWITLATLAAKRYRNWIPCFHIFSKITLILSSFWKCCGQRSKFSCSGQLFL